MVLRTVLGIFMFLSNAMAVPLLTPLDIRNLPTVSTPSRISYGTDSQQFGDLRVPVGDGPHPVLVVIHGGCWTSKMADLNFMAPFAEAFLENGIATWNIEFRGIDTPGGGWPRTFLDVGAAVDHLRVLAPDHHLDLTKVAIVGHSSGGSLALWAAGRHRLEKNSDLYVANPLSVKGVINIAGFGDLRPLLPLQKKICGQDVIFSLLGSSETVLEERLKQASPYDLLPLGVTQVFVAGTQDLAAPDDNATEDYINRALNRGDDISSILLEDTGHFEPIAPGTPAWHRVREQVIPLFSHATGDPS